MWHVISLVLTIVGAFWGIAKLLLANYTSGIDEKFGQVADRIKELAQLEVKRGDDVLKLERELAALRLEMMRDFTRREDHNQAIAGIRVSLDNMSLRIEKALASGGRIDG
ncbi:MAG: hypothetical protein QM702_04430 [Rubrivivax sp.]